MKSKFGREIGLLLLPFLIIGGVGWLASRNGRELVGHWKISNPFDPGPMRLEFTPPQKVEVSALDASRGINWAAQTTVRERGKWDVPQNWRDDGVMNRGGTLNARLVYRCGAVWKAVPLAKSGNRSLLTFSIGANDKLTIQANLKTVPRDAIEVRLRGQFEQIHLYRGPLPVQRSRRMPKNLKTTGLNQWLRMQSAPFDVQIKGSNEPLPAPKVSHEAQIKIVDAKWLTDVSRDGQDFKHDVLVLQMRHKDGSYFDAPPRLFGENLQLLDAHGKKFDIFDFGGKKWDLQLWLDPSFSFSPNRSNQDLFAVIATGQAKPKGGWNSVDAPLRLRGEVVDRESWPQKVDVEIKRLLMKTEDFGAAK